MTEPLKAVAQPILFAPLALAFVVGGVLAYPVTLLVETVSPPRNWLRPVWLAVYWPLAALGFLGMAMMAPLVFLMEWAETPNYRPGPTIRKGLGLLNRAVRYA